MAGRVGKRVIYSPPKTADSAGGSAKLAAMTGASDEQRVRQRVDEILLDSKTPEGRTMAHFLSNASSVMHNSRDEAAQRGGAVVSGGVVQVHNFCFAMQVLVRRRTYNNNKSVNFKYIRKTSIFF